MKDYILVTGGAGFIGSNLIEYFLKNTKKKIISLDNYSTGLRSNHIKSSRIKYFKGETKNIKILFNKYKKKIHSLFHFGEFSRIYQSFENFDICYNSNSIGSKEVFKFCLDNKIKLIYSATSASLGNSGKDKNLSPYAFTKAKNLELLENLQKWYSMNYEIIYFYNVYGPRQICKGEMATVIGIFEKLYNEKKPLTIVKPGTQTRRFTHVYDTVKACYYAWKRNKCKHYSITNKKSYSILDVARMFKSRIIYLPTRKGERFASKLTRMNLDNKVIKIYGRISLKNYISNIVN